MHSRGHRANILNPEYTGIGVGVVTNRRGARGDPGFPHSQQVMTHRAINVTRKRTTRQCPRRTNGQAGVAKF
jgi:cysteine-rich secretory family protein